MTAACAQGVSGSREDAEAGAVSGARGWPGDGHGGSALRTAVSRPGLWVGGFVQGEPLVLKHLFFPTGQVCPLPPMVSHGDFLCHPRPCDRYHHGTVVEFYCDPGYGLTSDYKYITCQYGEWFPSYQVYCIKSGECGPRPARGPRAHRTAWL